MNYLEKQKSLTAQAEVIFHRAKAEGRDLTESEVKQKNDIFSELEAIKTRTGKEHNKNLAALAFASGHGNAGVQSLAEAEYEGDGVSDIARTVSNFAKGYGNKDILEVRRSKDNFIVTTGVDSGALVPRTTTPPTIVRRLYNSIAAAIVSRGYPPFMTETAETMVIPVVDDTSVSGDTPAENATTDTAADPAITNLTLGATLFSSKSIWLSNTMINTVGYDLVGYLMPLLDKRVELEQDAAWITKLLVSQVSGNTLTAAAASVFTYNELTALYHTVSAPYRSDAVWIVSDSFLLVLRQMKDSQGRPLFNMLDPLVNAGAIGYLMGCPVYISTSMPAIAANAVTAFFGSAECLKARYVSNRRLARYTNIPTFPDQVGFRLFENSDFAVNPAGIAFLKMGVTG